LRQKKDQCIIGSKYAQGSKHPLREIIIRKLINSPINPVAPPHMGAALKGKLQDSWIDYLFNAYDKLYDTGTLNIFISKQFNQDRYNNNSSLSDT